MDKTYWLTEEDKKGRYKILPPDTYFCIKCGKQIVGTPQYVKDEIMHIVRPCQNCGGFVVGSM